MESTTWIINRPSPGTSRGTATWIIVMVTVAGTAFALRLAPALAGGGLFGRGNYDDGVYYTAASGFVHGLMPYRDFLLLHPPGIVLALAPFAALADLVGDPTAFAVARIGFIIIGSADAVLVAVALRRLGPAAAMVGGLTYAVFFPAVYVEHTTLLEPLATSCLLGAVILTGSAPRSDAVESQSGAKAGRSAHTGLLPMIMASVLLGVATAIKVWGVVPAVAMIAWVLATLGWRRALAMTAGTRRVPPRSACRSSWRHHGRCGDWSCSLNSAARSWPAAGRRLARAGARYRRADSIRLHRDRVVGPGRSCPPALQPGGLAVSRGPGRCAVAWRHGDAAAHHPLLVPSTTRP